MLALTEVFASRKKHASVWPVGRAIIVTSLYVISAAEMASVLRLTHAAVTKGSQEGHVRRLFASV